MVRTEERMKEKGSSTSKFEMGNVLQHIWLLSPLVLLTTLGANGEPVPVQIEPETKTYGGSPCVFPFTFQGTTFTECTAEKDRLPWCATKLDQEGNYIEDQWDYCDYEDDDPAYVSSSTIWRGGEECANPCSGQKCAEVAMMMNHLIDFTVDPCHDFFAFSCRAKTRGQKPPIARARIADFKSLIMDPPDGFEYIKKFFTSCIKIQTERTTQEVFFNCAEGNGKCTEEKAAEYGDIYAQFFNHTKRFVNQTAFPAAVTPDWWEARGRVWFGDEGWTWWDFSADILKGYYFLAAFDVEDKTWNKRDKTWDKWDKFRTNLFFAPLIDSVAEKPNEFGSRHSIYLVPITIPHAIKTGNREYFEQYRHLLTGLISSFGEHTDQIE